MLDMSNDRENIDLLKKIGENIIPTKGYSNSKRYNTSSYIELNPNHSGKAFLFNLLHKDEIAVCNNFAVKNTKWDPHYHDEWEAFIVYEGSMNVSLYDEDNNLQKTISLYSSDIEKRIYWVRPKTTHSAEMLENCSFIAITIPGSPDFPGSSEEDIE